MLINVIHFMQRERETFFSQTIEVNLLRMVQHQKIKDIALINFH